MRSTLESGKSHWATLRPLQYPSSRGQDVNVNKQLDLQTAYSVIFCNVEMCSRVIRCSSVSSIKRNENTESVGCLRLELDIHACERMY